MNPFVASGLHSEALFSENFRGKVLMIDFWETICGACVEELPDLIRVQSLLSPQGFTLVGLSGDENVDDVVNYIAGRGINYPIAMGNNALQTALEGRLLGYPSKVLVDREGRIVGVYLGSNTEQGYRAIIEPLLRSSSLIRAEIARAGRNVSIHWPSSGTGYTVESTTQFEGVAWSPVTTPQVVTNGENVVTVPASASAQFFRLKQP